MPDPRAIIKSQIRTVQEMFTPNETYPDGESHAELFHRVYADRYASIEGIFPVPHGLPTPEQVQEALTEIHLVSQQLRSSSEIGNAAKAAYNLLENMNAAPTGMLVNSSQPYFSGCPIEELGAAGTLTRAMNFLIAFQSLSLQVPTQELMDTHSMSIDEAIEHRVSTNPDSLATLDGARYVRMINALTSNLGKLVQPPSAEPGVQF